MGYKWNELGINEITNLFLYGQFFSFPTSSLGMHITLQ